MDGFYDDGTRKGLHSFMIVIESDAFTHDGKMTRIEKHVYAKSIETASRKASIFLAYRVRHGRHNIARTRTDVWFSFHSQPWHGVQYGEWTQICHCRRTVS